MEYKEIRITICDDCMNCMDMDMLEETRIIHKRHCLYFCSALITSVFLGGVLYWSWIVLCEMDELYDYSLS